MRDFFILDKSITSGLNIWTLRFKAGTLPETTEADISELKGFVYVSILVDLMPWFFIHSTLRRFDIKYFTHILNSGKFESKHKTSLFNAMNNTTSSTYIIRSSYYRVNVLPIFCQYFMIRAFWIKRIFSPVHWVYDSCFINKCNFIFVNRVYEQIRLY